MDTSNSLFLYKLDFFKVWSSGAHLRPHLRP